MFSLIYRDATYTAHLHAPLVLFKPLFKEKKYCHGVCFFKGIIPMKLLNLTMQWPLLQSNLSTVVIAETRPQSGVSFPFIGS